MKPFDEQRLRHNMQALEADLDKLQVILTRLRDDMQKQKGPPEPRPNLFVRVWRFLFSNETR